MLILQLIIIQLVTFTALVLVLRKLLYTETANALRRLQRLNSENEIKMDELRKKNEEAEKKYLERIKRAEAEAERIRELAVKEGEEFKARTLNEARNEAEKIVAAARSAEEAMRSEIAVEMKLKNIDFACELLRQAFDDKAMANSHKGLTGEIISGIKKLNPDRIEPGLTDAEAICPYPLALAEKQKLEDALSKKAGRVIRLREKIDKKLIAGIIIKMGDLLLDGSILNKLKEAKRKLE